MKYIDVSEHQGMIDWDLVKPHIDGVLIRAGCGKRLDKYWELNVNECNRLKIPCGAYWFSYAKSVEEAKAEANRLLNAISKYRIELPLAYDFEYDSISNMTGFGIKSTKELITDMVKAFCGTLEKNGYYAMIYTNPDFLKYKFGDLSKFDLWLAAWGESCPMSCGIWQFGIGKIEGINTDVDVNLSYRDYLKIIRKANLNHLGLVNYGNDGDDTVYGMEQTSPPSPPNAITWAKELGFDISNLTASITKKQFFDYLYEYHKKRSDNE